MNSTKARIVTAILAFFILCAIGWAADENKKKEQQTSAPPPKAVKQQPKPAPQQQKPAQPARPVQQQQQRPAQEKQTPAYRPPGQQQPAYRPPSQQQANRPSQQANHQPQPTQRPGGTPSSGQRPGQVQRPGGGTMAGGNLPSHGGAAAAPARTLSAAESQQHIQELNRSRPAGMGINSRPLPQGNVTMHANGGRTISTNDGRQINLRRDGTVQRVTLPGGRVAAFRPDGHIRSYQGNGMRIERGFHGERHIERVLPGGRRVVSYGGHYGYVERPYFTRGGRAYYSRTYVVGGVAYTRVYSTRVYYGVTYYHYVPAYYYRPRFYVWLGDPWARPVYYHWGWYSAPPPWYAYYGPYFVPAPYYAAPSLWLTDYLMAENLRLAYEAGAANQRAADMQANQPPGQQEQQYTSQQTGDAGGQATPLTPEIKAEIADEVRRQINAEQAGAAPSPEQQAPPAAENQPPAALDPQQHVFVVNSAVNVTTDDGQDCSLSQGDVIKRLDDSPGQDNTVRSFVRSNKQGDCTAGTVVAVKVADLQEMNNDLHQQIDAGLKVMASNQGQGGLPPAPDTQTTTSVPAPPPDKDAASSLQGLQEAANQTEDQVQRDALAPQPASAIVRGH